MKMAIHPEMRRKGLGFFLLARMIEKGRSEGAEKIWLEVRLSNHVARGLYEKAGFMEVGRRKAYYSNGREDAVVMALNM
jgi:ribosomal-protein-alanine N-acetyltransferase